MSPTSLNYKHLEYFWTVVREGSMSRAAASLFVSQPAVSVQIRKLERQLGGKLFRREGRNLVLTERGRVVYRYADEIFALGAELAEAVRGTSGGRPRLLVGVIDAMPKLLAYRLLAPALQSAPNLRLIVHEGPPDRLYADLAVQALDLVLSDAPIPPTVSVRAFNHPLGECDVSLLGVPELARRLRPDFPQSLHGAPMLLPRENTTLRRSLNRWFEEVGAWPTVVAEIEDSAILKVFGQQGAGVFAVPTVVVPSVCAQYGVDVVGTIESIRERFYAISGERRVRHPAIVAITEAARDRIFVDGPAADAPG